MTEKSFTLTELRDADAFYNLLHDYEPRASHCLSVALKGLNRRTNRCRVAYDNNGTFAGAVVVHRWMLDRWLALPVLIDPDSAEIIADYIDRGPADGMHASAPDARLLMDNMKRVRRTIYERTVGLPYPIVWEEPDPHCRLARPEEEDQLIELYWRSELNFFPSKRVMKRLYSRDPDDVLVYDPGDGTGPVALFTSLGRTPDWDLAGDLVVHPDYRGQGISWAMLGFAIARATARKAGGFSFVRESNPMSVPIDTDSEDDFMYVELGSPRRFKGEPRLHRLGYYLTVRDREREQPRVFTHDRMDYVKRTQDAWRRRSSSRDKAADESAALDEG